MAQRLEHANLCVHDIDAVVRFLTTAFPDFQVRRDVTEPAGSRWVHVGTNETYIALVQAMPEATPRDAPYTGRPGLNHLAFEVDDVEALRVRLRAAGYRDSTFANAHPHRKRVYFHDPEGNDWEFVQYFSDDPKMRHDYDIPDHGGGVAARFDQESVR
jgi:catechol 2,3-dioxygenase-like lactoylglutathione lyase family enzyme